MRGALLLLAGAGAAAAADVGGSVGEFIPTELPRSEFPAATPLQSNIAWPSGHQPQRLEAWPQVGFGTSNRTLLSCWKVEVLRDTDDGWPGACLGLFKAEAFTSEVSCRQHCWDESRCSVWQYNNQTSPKQCWVGYGENCMNRKGEAESITVQGSQRVMHGEVRVLMSLSGWKVNNLWQMGMFQTGDQYSSMLRCKSWCYSNIACEYWQYGPGGCWLDAPMFSTQHGAEPQLVVQYPLTTNGGATRNTPEALTMQYGEYIQHYCPPRYPTSSYYPIAMKPDSNLEAPRSHWWLNWQFWVGLTVFTLLLIAAVIYLIMNRGGSRVAKKLRKRVAGEEEDKPLMLAGQSGHRFSVDQELYKSVPQHANRGIEAPQGLPPLPTSLVYHSQPGNQQQGRPMSTFQVMAPAPIYH